VSHRSDAIAWHASIAARHRRFENPVWEKPDKNLEGRCHNNCGASILTQTSKLTAEPKLEIDSVRLL
jgi:hypothetical protein